MKRNENQLIPVNNSLIFFEKQISIAEKLLGIKKNDLEKERIKEFLIEIIKRSNNDTFLRYISEFFPISNKLMEKYQNILKWNYLSINTKIKFSVDLIDKYSNRWDFHKLASNKSVNWNLDMIHKYNNEFDWWLTIDGHLNALPWSNNLVEHYGDRLNWNNFCCYEQFPWNEEFIDSHFSKINWDSLSINESFPWDENFIEKYKSKLNWKYLSINKNLPWSVDFFNKYISYWDWKNLSENEGLPWSKDFFCKYLAYWDMTKISRNQGILWTEDFFNEFLSHKKAVWGWLSYCSLPWSVDLILKYQDKLDWNSLTRNESIVWTDEMLNLFSDKIIWRIICQNKTFPLSLDYFINNPKKFDIDASFFIKIEQLMNIYLDDSFIEDIIIETQKTK